MFRHTNLYAEFIAEIQKPAPNFNALYRVWVRKNCYEILGVSGACTINQLQKLQETYPHGVRQALSQANLPIHCLNDAHSVAQLIDTALVGMINSKSGYSPFYP